MFGFPVVGQAVAIGIGGGVGRRQPWPAAGRFLAVDDLAGAVFDGLDDALVNRIPRKGAEEGFGPIRCRADKSVV